MPANLSDKVPEPLPVYQASLRENLQAFGEGLALNFSRRKVLIAGPYVGEFGHEIMDFQGYVRWFRRKYDQVHVITFPGRVPLYRGCVLHSHEYDLRNAGYFYGRISNQELQVKACELAKRLGLKDYDVFSPKHLRTRWHRRLLFRQAHEALAPLTPVRATGTILFHFRHINKTGPDNTRNIRPELAAELAELCRSRGLQVACIGHPQYSLCPQGCEDRRSEDLEETLSAIAASQMLVGELSGPIHLAVYSAKPVVIWAPGKHRIDYALKRNPFHVRMTVVRDDTTNPQPGEVLTSIEQACAVSAGSALAARSGL